VVQKVWPKETAHLFPEGEHRPLVVAAKLRPLIVLSRATEMAATGAALVIPTSEYVASDPHWRGQNATVEANTGWPHLHWLPASQRFRVIKACTLDFRWTYRLPVSMLQLAQASAPKGSPSGPVARLDQRTQDELLRRFRDYLS
jgi:hypothetical protein